MACATLHISMPNLVESYKGVSRPGRVNLLWASAILMGEYVSPLWLLQPKSVAVIAVASQFYCCALQPKGTQTGVPMQVKRESFACHAVSKRDLAWSEHG
jgi:hypothetical protein